MKKEQKEEKQISQQVMDLENEFENEKGKPLYDQKIRKLKKRKGFAAMQPEERRKMGRKGGLTHRVRRRHLRRR